MRSELISNNIYGTGVNNNKIYRSIKNTTHQIYVENKANQKHIISNFPTIALNSTSHDTIYTLDNTEDINFISGIPCSITVVLYNSKSNMYSNSNGTTYNINTILQWGHITIRGDQIGLDTKYYIDIWFQGTKHLDIKYLCNKYVKIHTLKYNWSTQKIDGTATTLKSLSTPSNSNILYIIPDRTLKTKPDPYDTVYEYIWDTNGNIAVFKEYYYYITRRKTGLSPKIYRSKNYIDWEETHINTDLSDTMIFWKAPMVYNTENTIALISHGTYTTGNIKTTKYLRTLDGINWEVLEAPVTGTMYYVKNVFLLIPEFSSENIYYSTNGIDWTKATVSDTNKPSTESPGLYDYKAFYNNKNNCYVYMATSHSSITIVAKNYSTWKIYGTPWNQVDGTKYSYILNADYSNENCIYYYYRDREERKILNYIEWFNLETNQYGTIDITNSNYPQINSISCIKSNINFHSNQCNNEHNWFLIERENSNGNKIYQITSDFKQFAQIVLPNTSKPYKYIRLINDALFIIATDNDSYELWYSKQPTCYKDFANIASFKLVGTFSYMPNICYSNYTWFVMSNPGYPRIYWARSLDITGTPFTTSNSKYFGNSFDDFDVLSSDNEPIKIIDFNTGNDTLIIAGTYGLAGIINDLYNTSVTSPIIKMTEVTS